MNGKNDREDSWLRSLFSQAPVSEPMASGVPLPDAEEIETWIVSRLAARLDTPVAAIDPAQPLSRYGMDSQNALRLAGELEDWLGRELSPTLVWDYPTVEQLARHLADDLRQPSAHDIPGAD